MKAPELALRQNSFHPGNAAELLREILTIQEGFRSLERSIDQVDELIAAKYRTQHWRKSALELAFTLLEQHANSGNEEELAALRALAELQLKLPSPRLRTYMGRVLAGGNRVVVESLARTLAESGEPELLSELLRTVDIGEQAGSLRRIAGPSKKLPIRANAPSRAVFEKWSGDAEFSRHELNETDQGTEIRYRGISFCSGDLLISNVNRDGNGIYTALQSPRSYAYHLGVVAVLEVDRRRIPVVIEGYKLGVRAVPLSTFLSPEFNSYVEVCRLREIPRDFPARLNEQAATLPKIARGYNFDTEDPDMSYLACTSVASCLYQRSGVTPISTKSRYHLDPQVQQNMATFDFGVSSFLSLTDFLVDRRMCIVGVVDNGHLTPNIARELCERHFLTVFGRGELVLGELPLMFTLNRFGIRQMRKGTALGALIGLPYGLTQDNLPKGPEKVLAIIEIYEHLLEKAVRSVTRALEDRGVAESRTSLVDIDRLALDPKLLPMLDEALTPISRAYRPSRLPEQAVAQ